VRITLSGGITRDVVEGCPGTAAGGGCSTCVWTRRERQRNGSAAGGHPRFLGDTYPAIFVPSPTPTSCRKRTGAGLHEHPMRDLAKPGPARRPGAFPRRLARGYGSRDRASDEAGMVGCGALRRERGCQKKRGWPPAELRSACRSRRPQKSPARPATADVRDTVSRMVRATASRDACIEIRNEPERAVLSAPQRLCVRRVVANPAGSNGPRGYAIRSPGWRRRWHRGCC
jgi:hypothetical protein